ncbi:MAG: class I SAM-dependent methyltransferase [Rhodothermales bacterium]
MQKTFALQYENYEQEHWWFRARQIILKDQIRVLDLPSQANIMEIGVGPGKNLYSLYSENAKLIGVEPDPMLVKTAQARGHIPVYEATAEQMPPEILDDSYDAVTMFDILEHTEDDVFVLECVKRKIKAGGLLVISVPAFMMLWGQQDVINLHYRRYTRKNLEEALRKAGFEIMKSTYFNSILFPFVALVRIVNRIFKNPEKQAQSDFTYSLGKGDELLYRLFASEKWFLRYMNFPIGVSLFCVARKPSD